MSPDDVQKEIEQLEQRFAENSKGLVFAHLADAYRKAGEYGKAEGLILHGLKNHPNYISAYNVLGRVYLDSERLAEANQQFSRVLELDPHNLIALRALGDLAARDGEMAAARSWYERMLQVDPRNEEARAELQKLESGAGVPVPASEGETAPEETAAPEAIGREPEGADIAGDVAEESADLQIVDSPGLESAPQAEGASQDEGWDVRELDVVAHHVEDQDERVEPVEGLMSESELSAFAEEEAAEPSPGWQDLDEIETADRPSSALSDVPEEGAVEEPTAPPAETADPMPHSRSEWELGDIDAWTPGLLADDELAKGDADIQDIDDDFDLNLLDEDEPGLGGAQDDAGAPDELTSDDGVVTETMAELYAQQGLHHDALKIYEQLLDVRPNDDRIRARVMELREMLDMEASTASEDDEFAALLELTEPEASGGAWSDTDSVLQEGDEETLGTGPSEPGSSASGGLGGAGGIDEPEVESVLREALESDDEATRARERDDFEFEDGAPVAGIEHLDPFAASFDVFAKQEGAGHEAAPLMPRAAEAVPTEEVQADLESEPELEPEAEVTHTTEAEASEMEADVPEWESAAVGELEPESSEPWLQRLAPDDERELEVETPTAELEPEPAAEVGPPGDAMAAAGYLDEWEAEPAEPEPQPAGATEDLRTDEPEISIEEYLTGLLSYEAGSRTASMGEEPVETAPADAAAQAEEPAKGEGEVDRGAEGGEGGKDLEEFQEWLRSLKR